MVVQDVHPPSYTTPEKETRLCYRLRALDRFAGFLGLASVERVKSEDFVDRGYVVSSLPLLFEAVKFKL